MSQSPATKEPQYSLLFDVKEKHGIARLGLMVNESWNQDPKRTLFTLARYKFVARMENIWISGRLWGLSPSQIRDSLDDIVNFTELGDYLNVPVRTYSAGMLLRLAFAIATVRDPEILLLDEIVGVGDATFFEKAFNRLQGIIRRSQILFLASHADDILRKICNKAIWLDQGNLVQYGEFEQVIAAYRGSRPLPENLPHAQPAG